MNKEVHMVHGNINTNDKTSHTTIPLVMQIVNPATSAAGERFFSTARRLKTWLPSRMNQERFSNLTVLNIHKERTDRTDKLFLTVLEIEDYYMYVDSHSLILNLNTRIELN